MEIPKISFYNGDDFSFDSVRKKYMVDELGFYEPDYNLFRKKIANKYFVIKQELFTETENEILSFADRDLDIRDNRAVYNVYLADDLFFTAYDMFAVERILSRITGIKIDEVLENVFTFNKEALNE